MMGDVYPDPSLPEPQSQLGNLIRRAQQLHIAMWNRLVSGETSSAQYSILLTLERRGEASQRELCDAVDLDRSTVADLVRRLEARGLIKRSRATDDARRNVVTPTVLGLAERRRLHPLVAEVQQLLVEGLSDSDAAALHRGLERMLETNS